MLPIRKGFKYCKISSSQCSHTLTSGTFTDPEETVKVLQDRQLLLWDFITTIVIFFSSEWFPFIDYLIDYYASVDAFIEDFSNYKVVECISVTSLQRNLFNNNKQPAGPWFCWHSSFLSCLLTNLSHSWMHTLMTCSGYLCLICYTATFITYSSYQSRQTKCFAVIKTHIFTDYLQSYWAFHDAKSVESALFLKGIFESESLFILWICVVVCN